MLCCESHLAFSDKLSRCLRCGPRASCVMQFLGHQNMTPSGVRCSRGQPVRADAHAQSSTESSPNFIHEFGARRTLPNPNFGRFDPCLASLKFVLLLMATRSDCVCMYGCVSIVFRTAQFGVYFVAMVPV